jgi:hypothetical protein
VWCIPHRRIFSKLHLKKTNKLEKGETKDKSERAKERRVAGRATAGNTLVA